MHEIERQKFPLPRKGDGCLYPFLDLEIGDSFHVLLKDDQDIRKIANTLCSTARYHGKNQGKKFTCRRTDTGVRCWRFE